MAAKVSPANLNFSVKSGQGNPTSQSVQLTGFKGSWSVSSSQSWISASPDSGAPNSGTEVSVQITDLPVGEHKGVLSFEIYVSTASAKTPEVSMVDVPVSLKIHA